MKDKPAKKVAGRKKNSPVSKELLTEVPPSIEAEMLTEVPPEDDVELLVEKSYELVRPPPVDPNDPRQLIPPFPDIFVGPVAPVVPDSPPPVDPPYVGPTPPVAPSETKKPKKPKKRQHTPEQIKKLRGEFSRRTLQTRFGITW